MKHFYAFGIIHSNSSLCDPALKTADSGKPTEFAYSEEFVLLKLAVTSRPKLPCVVTWRREKDTKNHTFPHVGEKKNSFFQKNKNQEDCLL